MQDGLRAIDNQGMSGVMPSLEAYNHVCALGQEIDNLALALIPPLHTNHYDVFCHDDLFVLFIKQNTHVCVSLHRSSRFKHSSGYQR